MTPEEAEEYNRTAPHAAQAHQCRECGRYFTGPAWLRELIKPGHIAEDNRL